jgi:hypothetical protein
LHQMSSGAEVVTHRGCLWEASMGTGKPRLTSARKSPEPPVSFTPKPGSYRLTPATSALGRNSHNIEECPCGSQYTRPSSAGKGRGLGGGATFAKDLGCWPARQARDPCRQSTGRSLCWEPRDAGRVDGHDVRAIHFPARTRAVTSLRRYPPPPFGTRAERLALRAPRDTRPPWS